MQSSLTSLIATVFKRNSMLVFILAQVADQSKGFGSAGPLAEIAMK